MRTFLANLDDWTVGKTFHPSSCKERTYASTETRSEKDAFQLLIRITNDLKNIRAPSSALQRQENSRRMLDSDSATGLKAVHLSIRHGIDRWLNGEPYRPFHCTIFADEIPIIIKSSRGRVLYRR